MQAFNIVKFLLANYMKIFMISNRNLINFILKTAKNVFKDYIFFIVASAEVKEAT